MTGQSEWLVVAPLAGIAADLLVHMILARAALPGAPVRIQFVAIAVGLAVTGVILAVMLIDTPMPAMDVAGRFALHLLAYICLGFVLFNVVNANVSSLRIRMLKEYLAHDPAPFADSDMFLRYPAREILEGRLVRLQAGGQIEARDGRFHISGRLVVTVGRFFAALRALLLGA
jgi:hypothetical protein